ncbi:MAG: DUF3467 domain-containing protein [Bacteroidales bacterium]|nr:DUF3467 domain-containing protein [Bacteroidales bacterium]
MDQNKKNHENQLEIELSDDVAQGTYSNLAVISHSTSEFVLDFIRVVPGVPKAQVKSRIILTPDHAKRLMAALEENIEKFEKMNGPVSVDNENLGFIPPLGNIGQA